MSQEKTKKKKGFFSNLSNLMFESNESNSSSEEVVLENDIVVSNSNPQPIVSVNQNFAVPLTGDGVFDKNFNDSLEQLIQDNNIEGVDYLEFKQALKGMAGVAGLNESAAYQSVFSVLKTGSPNLTKEHLVKAVDFYISILKGEENTFNSEMQENIEREVTSRRAEVDNLSLENKELVDKIQSINEKIAQNQQRAIQLNSEASDVEAKVNQASKNFVATLSHVISNLESDKNKIIQLIQE